MSSDKVIYATSLDDIPKTGNVVIDFYADWCGPCKKLSPEFSRLSNEYETITFIKVNVDDAENLCKHYEVSSLPTVIFVKDNDIVSIIKGFSLDKLTSELNELAK